MPADAPTAAPPTLESIEAHLKELSVESSQAEWVYATYITPDTEALAARAFARMLNEAARYSRQLGPAPAVGASAEVARKTKLLKLLLPVCSPNEPKDAEVLARTIGDLQGTFAKGRFRPARATLALDVEGLSKILATSRDPGEMAEVWTGWHAIARPMRPGFTRYVDLANRGARDNGFDDLGAMWRAKYDLSPEEFAREVQRLWEQVEPLYRRLHAYTRRRLSALYGPEVVPPDGPLPGHLLGNMWAQSWEHLFPILAPPDADPGFDLTAILRAKGVDETGLVRMAERFFVSLGLDPLPSSFWERSMFRRPADRDVVCHASAWDLDGQEDLRIKMCIDVTAEEFHVIHHELGHNYYQRAYRHQPFLFQDGAHDGFHEAVGDTISLSITPGYLKTIGLLPEVPDPSKDLGLLMQRALEKVVFLPFGLLIDRWRWKVFDGEIGPDRYNESWWRLRAEYQGIRPPVERTEADFDPGAKYHVPANVPYMRYFLAHILQFQFHR
ncbi:MAG TPA: M2 family metallopeptidase, partial [Thermoplasmata archaeon]|nr:M2 family metallopeptidase [Thermoplasmata archaeon]